MKKKWWWSDDKGAEKPEVDEIPWGCAEKLFKLGRGKEEKNEDSLMTSVCTILAKAIGLKLELGGASIDTAAQPAARPSRSKKSNEKETSQRKSSRPAQYRTDGAILGNKGIVYVIMEGKFYTLTAGDLLFQVLRYCEDYRDRLPPKWGQGNEDRGGLFPIYAITVMGNAISLYGVVTIVEDGSDGLAEKMSYCRLASVDISTAKLQSIKQFLSMLRGAVHELKKKHYDEYKNKKRPRELSPTLPANGVFEGQDLEFTAAFPRRPLMFLSDWKSKDGEADAEKVIVKFSEERYGKEVHDFCSERGIAPKCHGVRNVGPFKMIVMEKCDEEFVQFVDAKEEKENWFDEEKAYKAVEKALEVLYNEGGEKQYVHGDFRDVNVLINRDFSVKIVDFDWAGIDSQVNYPPRLNHGGINWHIDAKEGHPIRHAHDVHFLETYFR